MTYAPDTLKAARNLLLEHLDIHPTGSYPADLDPAEVGIVGDTAHAAKGTSYHLGADQLTSTAYSRRTARDKAGLTNAASAVDVGTFRITTGRGTFTQRNLAVWSVEQCQANHPDTRDIREIIYSADGKTVLRYDRERGYASEPRSGEADSSHLSHDHYSQYRDAEYRYTLRDHYARWLTHIGAIGDDDMGNYCNQGDISENVRRLQLALNRISEGVTNPVTLKPYVPLVVDAKYGETTAARLKALLDGTGKNYNAEMDLRMDAALARLAVPPAKDGVDGKDGEDGKDGVVPDGAVFVMQAPPTSPAVAGS